MALVTAVFKLPGLHSLDAVERGGGVSGAAGSAADRPGLGFVCAGGSTAYALGRAEPPRLPTLLPFLQQGYNINTGPWWAVLLQLQFYGAGSRRAALARRGAARHARAR
jgi:hypothetical protein